MSARILVLDLDGTLIDSLPDIAAALNRMLRQRNLAELTRDEVAAMVGDGSHRLVERAFAARGAEADEAAFASFLADYTQHATGATRPFPDVPETLALLQQQGWRLAICTNKIAAAAHRVLAALGLAPFFAAIGAGDSFPTRKPDPAHLLATIAAAGGTAAHAAMVGDHVNDIAAASGAGLPSIFATWGYGPPELAARATAVAQRFAALPDIAARLVPEARR